MPEAMLSPFLTASGGVKIIDKLDDVALSNEGVNSCAIQELLVMVV